VSLRGTWESPAGDGFAERSRARLPTRAWIEWVWLRSALSVRAFRAHLRGDCAARKLAVSHTGRAVDRMRDRLLEQNDEHLELFRLKLKPHALLFAIPRASRSNSNTPKRIRRFDGYLF